MKPTWTLILSVLVLAVSADSVKATTRVLELAKGQRIVLSEEGSPALGHWLVYLPGSGCELFPTLMTLSSEPLWILELITYWS